MVDGMKNSASNIATLQQQMARFSSRITDLEQVKAQQESTIRMQQEEWTAASSTIQVLYFFE